MQSAKCTNPLDIFHVMSVHDLSAISAQFVKITTSGRGMSENSKRLRLMDLAESAVFPPGVTRKMLDSSYISQVTLEFHISSQ